MNLLYFLFKFRLIKVPKIHDFVFINFDFFFEITTLCRPEHACCELHYNSSLQDLKITTMVVTPKTLCPHCSEAPWCRTMQKPSSLRISWRLSPQNCPFAMKQTTQNWGAQNLVISFFHELTC